MKRGESSALWGEVWRGPTRLELATSGVTGREAATDKLGADALEEFSEERDNRDYDYEFSLKPPGPLIS